jgi:1A family penicillin-binding protein
VHLIPSFRAGLLRSARTRRILAAAVGLAGLVLFAAWRDLVRDLPDRQAIGRISDTAQSTIVFDSSGRPASTIFTQERIDMPLARVSPQFLQALLAIEDQRFYSHGAVDVPRIVSAAFADLLHWRVVQGASTLTQQLARTSFLTPRKTLRRKLQEIILAGRIEHQYSKQQILELYVNRVYFGGGLWGVEAASLGYFGKHASDLTLPEAALLAGLVKSPSAYAPTADVDKAIRRRDSVLRAMYDNRVIDLPTLKQATSARVALKDALSRQEPHGEYFFEEVRKSLADRFGSSRVYEGGLRVYSTIDPQMQAAAETAVAASLKSLDERRAHSKGRSDQQNDILQAALIAIDPRTGYVRALVGGRDFATSRFDRAMQAHRQPGSAFKPFVYAAALEAGYAQTSVIDHLDEPISTLQGDWLPDDEHADASSLDLRSALRVSSNRAAIQLLQQVGIPRVVRYASALGLDDQPSVPSLALGSGEVTLASLTSAYAAFANGGWLRAPVLIREVDDGNGQVLMAHHDEPSRAMSATTAFIMSDMLADVVNAGTAAQARRLGFTLPAAGKTGTTNGFNDAWFVGYTPSLVVGVWVGFDMPHTIMRNGFAASVAVPLWTEFMKTVTRGDRPEWFQPPAGVVPAEICPESEKLATDRCTDRRREYFATGTEPTEYCDVHKPSFFRRLFGLAATPAPLTVDGLEDEPIQTSIPPSSASAAADRAAESPAPAKKHGFWWRLVHAGGDR